MKYLVRAGFNPYKSNKLSDALYANITGNNSGNMLYAYGVMNVLDNGKNEVIPTYYKTDYSDVEIERINSEFDMFILPLADCFGEHWTHKLKAYTALLSRIKIPCIVIGACLRAPYEPQIHNGFQFDSDVYNFVKVVLEHSAKLGLRGDITGDYLSRLGFKAERDYTTIGCPSLYTYGNTTRTKELPETVHNLAFNFNPLVPDNVNRLILNSANMADKRCLITQTYEELLYIYLNRNIVEWNSKIFTKETMNRYIRCDEIRFFYNVPQWYKTLGQFDLSVGCRFHGTVASVLAGIPHVVIPIDSRMRELVQYHKLTNINKDNLKENVFEHIPELDFHSFEKSQGKNLEHYQAFLRENGLSTVFDNGLDMTKGRSPLETRQEPCPEDTYILPFINAPLYEKVRRYANYTYHKVKRRLK